MKRPEGFDEPRRPAGADEVVDPAPGTSRRRRRRDPDATGPIPVVSDRPAARAPSTATPTAAVSSATDADPGRDGPPAVGLRERAARLAGGPAVVRERLAGRSSTRPDAAAEPPRIVAPDTSADEAEGRAAAARRRARKASSERRRVERAEVRRFTRRSRHRRATLISLGAVVLLLVASVAVAVFSPLLSLQTVRVEGTDRVDAAQVQAAVAGQVGTPLALLDFDEITRELAAFPLIASYVTETAPPHTLVIRIQERQPVATVAVGDAFELVDPAGVVVQRLDARQEGVPLVDVGGAPLDGPAYRSVAEVLLALPVTLRSTVDTVSASTNDDVTLQLTSGERVVWGSADESAKKAQVLTGLIADQARRDPGASVEYDVSAPDNGIIRTR